MMATKTIEEEEKDTEDFYKKESMSDRDAFNYKGAFVGILAHYMGTRKKLKISSFTHKNIECYVLASDARIVRLKKCIDGKVLYLAQTSIKDIEEI
jgi:hypothetical protein